MYSPWRLKVLSFYFWTFLDFWITGVTVHDCKSSLLGKLCRLWRLYGYAELTVMFENTLSCWKEPSEDEYTVIMIGWTGSATVLRYIVAIKWCLINNKGTRVHHGNIPHTITPPAAWIMNHDTRQDGSMLSCCLFWSYHFMSQQSLRPGKIFPIFCCQILVSLCTLRIHFPVLSW